MGDGIRTDEEIEKSVEIKLRDEVSESTFNALLCGGKYNFKNQPERLKYIGQHRGWHQFEKVGEVGVWCELLDSDLHMIEETDDFNKEENDDFNYEHDYDVGN